MGSAMFAKLRTDDKNVSVPKDSVGSESSSQPASNLDGVTTIKCTTLHGKLSVRNFIVYSLLH